MDPVVGMNGEDWMGTREEVGKDGGERLAMVMGWRGWLTDPHWLPGNNSLKSLYTWMWRGAGPCGGLGSAWAECLDGLQAGPVSEPQAKEGGNPARGLGPEEEGGFAL